MVMGTSAQRVNNEAIFFISRTDNGFSFSNPDNLSKNIGISSNPQLGVQGNNVFVVWQDGLFGSFDILFTSNYNNGLSFNFPPDNLSQNPGNSEIPRIALQ